MWAGLAAGQGRPRNHSCHPLNKVAWSILSRWRNALAKCPSVLDSVTVDCWENLNTGLPVAKPKATLLVGVSCKPILLPRSQHKPCYLQASDAEGKAGVRTHRTLYSEKGVGKDRAER